MAAAAVAGHTVVLGNAALSATSGFPSTTWVTGPNGCDSAANRCCSSQSMAGPRDSSASPMPGADTATDVMEDEMRDSVSTADQFPTATADLPKAQSAERSRWPTAPVQPSYRAGTKRSAMRRCGCSPTTGPFQDRRFACRKGRAPGQCLNEGDLEATVHWHGLRLENRYDGTLATQRPIPVGGTFTYRLTFPDPGVYWYHPHIREDYGQEMGLYGNIVVVPSEPDYWPPAHRELTLTLDDILLEDGKVAPFSRLHPTYTAMGRFGNVLLVNGEPQLSIRARHGEVVRFYLTNTANTRVFNVGLRGARMKLVGGDSGRYERETFVESVVIAPSSASWLTCCSISPERSRSSTGHPTERIRWRPSRSELNAQSRLWPRSSEISVRTRT